MPLTIVNADITTLHVDAIVNAANEQLLMGGGVCRAIFEAAGPNELQAACDKIGHCDTGSAVATPGFDLPAKYVIHAVGPIWQGGNAGEKDLLASCYTASLQLAQNLGCSSVAFPLISSGIYGYPRAEACQVAMESIERFLVAGPDHDDMQVYLVLFRHGRSLIDARERRSLDAYIDNRLARERLEKHRLLEQRQLNEAASLPQEPQEDRSASMPTPRLQATGAARPNTDFAASKESSARKTKGLARRHASPDSQLAHLLDKVDAPFGDTLIRLIDERGLTDADVYHRANMSRQHFAKLRAGGNPSKRTVLALCVALGLDLDDSAMLLQRAGFAFNPSDKGDIIVEYFLERGGATVVDVNLALYEYDQPLLTR